MIALGLLANSGKAFVEAQKGRVTFSEDVQGSPKAPDPGGAVFGGGVMGFPPPGL